MEKIKLGLFDVFVYMLPGSMVVLCFLLLKLDLDIDIEISIDRVFRSVSKFNGYSFILLLVISYVIGFVFHPIGHRYFSFIGKRLWRKRLNIPENIVIKKEYRHLVVRHFSQENFTFAEKWFAYRGLSFNLSLSLLILFFIVIFKMFSFPTFSFDWFIISLMALLFSIILLRRAITFHLWAKGTINGTIEALNLDGENLRYDSEVSLK